MIYGVNFNGSPIPPYVARLFAKRLKIRKDGTLRSVGSDSSCDYTLQGVCNTDSEWFSMRAQADNGNRVFWRRKRSATTLDGKSREVWVAFYVGYR